MDGQKASPLVAVGIEKSAKGQDQGLVGTRSGVHDLGPLRLTGMDPDDPDAAYFIDSELTLIHVVNVCLFNVCGSQIKMLNSLAYVLDTVCFCLVLRALRYKDWL